ncbi:hypothetical protein FA09DRAFT_119134 [Tilletiopsis washingtonensis]|uniref:Uncharacterized protein n=1 Tax=Tilletiopsis washingtonensis TaxID=58919 RepID=A0A316ZIK8_9BASI|nr:hypothetical protein FA09DRAFT_119134 [Tilletiopsis washingtonensis]PWO00919.1 hypothetical protein FA09DRAFT_119134 [Tilletiopsis washingtonensis]
MYLYATHGSKSSHTFCIRLVVALRVVELVVALRLRRGKGGRVVLRVAGQRRVGLLLARRRRLLWLLLLVVVGRAAGRAVHVGGAAHRVVVLVRLGRAVGVGHHAVVGARPGGGVLRLLHRVLAVVRRVRRAAAGRAVVLLLLMHRRRARRARRAGLERSDARRTGRDGAVRASVRGPQRRDRALGCLLEAALGRVPAGRRRLVRRHVARVGTLHVLRGLRLRRLRLALLLLLLLLLLEALHLHLVLLHLLLAQRLLLLLQRVLLVARLRRVVAHAGRHARRRHAWRRSTRRHEVLQVADGHGRAGSEVVHDARIVDDVTGRQSGKSRQRRRSRRGDGHRSGSGTRRKLDARLGRSGAIRRGSGERGRSFARVRCIGVRCDRGGVCGAREVCRQRSQLAAQRIDTDAAAAIAATTAAATTSASRLARLECLEAVVNPLAVLGTRIERRSGRAGRRNSLGLTLWRSVVGLRSSSGSSRSSSLAHGTRSSRRRRAVPLDDRRRRCDGSRRPGRSRNLAHCAPGQRVLVDARRILLVAPAQHAATHLAAAAHDGAAAPAATSTRAAGRTSRGRSAARCSSAAREAASRGAVELRSRSSRVVAIGRRCTAAVGSTAAAAPPLAEAAQLRSQQTVVVAPRGAHARHGCRVGGQARPVARQGARVARARRRRRFAVVLGRWVGARAGLGRCGALALSTRAGGATTSATSTAATSAAASGSLTGVSSCRRHRRAVFDELAPRSSGWLGGLGARAGRGLAGSRRCCDFLIRRAGLIMLLIVVVVLAVVIGRVGVGLRRGGRGLSGASSLVAAGLVLALPAEAWHGASARLTRALLGLCRLCGRRRSGLGGWCCGVGRCGSTVVRCGCSAGVGGRLRALCGGRLSALDGNGDARCRGLAAQRGGRGRR